MRTMASTIADALTQADPYFGPLFHDNLIKLQADLTALDAELRAILTPVHGQTLLVFHPSYGYFAKAYGLKQLAIEKDGKEPLPGDLRQLVDQAKKAKTKALFVQPNFSTRTAETVAQGLGARVIVLDPLAEDYLVGMRTLAHQIASGLEGPTTDTSLPGLPALDKMPSSAF